MTTTNLQQKFQQAPRTLSADQAWLSCCNNNNRNIS